MKKKKGLLGGAMGRGAGVWERERHVSVFCLLKIYFCLFKI